jgi:hypothetical protein
VPMTQPDNENQRAQVLARRIKRYDRFLALGATEVVGSLAVMGGIALTIYEPSLILDKGSPNFYSIALGLAYTHAVALVAGIVGIADGIVRYKGSSDALRTTERDAAREGLRVRGFILNRTVTTA